MIVWTETSSYEIDLAAMLVRRMPGAPTEEVDLAVLRKDGEVVPLIAVLHLEVGHPMELLIDVRGDGVQTWRKTTRVGRIVE